MKKFNLVFACDKNGGIGKDNDIPWDLPEEKLYFNELTSATTYNGNRNAVIMGRLTWESIPEDRRPLKDRYNVVLSRNDNLELPKGVHRSKSLDAAISHLEGIDTGIIFVIGGVQSFKETLGHTRTDRLYLTRIDANFDCDVVLPPFEDYFELETSSKAMKENGLSYRYLVYRHNILK